MSWVERTTECEDNNNDNTYLYAMLLLLFPAAVSLLHQRIVGEASYCGFKLDRPLPSQILFVSICLHPECKIPLRDIPRGEARERKKTRT